MITFYTMYNFQIPDRLFCIKCHFVGYGMIMRDSSALTRCYEITEPLPQTLSSVYSINLGVHSMLKAITSSLLPDHSNLHHKYIYIELKSKYGLIKGVWLRWSYTKKKEISHFFTEWKFMCI